jgi:hypothetical protein
MCRLSAPGPGGDQSVNDGSRPEFLPCFRILLDCGKRFWDALLSELESVGDLRLGIGTEALLEHGDTTGQDLP